MAFIRGITPNRWGRIYAARSKQHIWVSFCLLHFKRAFSLLNSFLDSIEHIIPSLQHPLTCRSICRPGARACRANTLQPKSPSATCGQLAPEPSLRNMLPGECSYNRSSEVFRGRQ